MFLFSWLGGFPFVISTFRGLRIDRDLARFEGGLSGKNCSRLRTPSSLRGCHAEVDDLGRGFQYCLCIPWSSVMLRKDRRGFSAEGILLGAFFSAGCLRLRLRLPVLILFVSNSELSEGGLRIGRWRRAPLWAQIGR